MKTAFAVLQVIEHGNDERDENFVCVRRNFGRAAEAASKIKPAVILEMALGPEVEKQQLNRWDLT